MLTYRKQRVLVKCLYSEIVTTGTGSLHGCSQSAMLYITYTNRCRSTEDNVVEFSDDIRLLTLVQSLKKDHGDELSKTCTLEWGEFSATTR